MTKKRGWTLGSIAQIVVPIAILAPLLYFGYNAFTTQMDLAVALEDQGIHVRHSRGLLMAAEDFIIPYADITSVEILAGIPPMDKIKGLNSSKARIGDFTVEGLGAVKAYVADARVGGG